MADFESGVKRYIKTAATVKVFFPVDWNDKADVSCRQCRFYRRSSITCALTGDVIPYPEKHIAPTCPLKEIKEE